MCDDKILVMRLKGGDEAAFDKLYYKYAPLIKYIIFDVTRTTEAIDDICQIVFMKIWRNIQNYKGGSFKYYLVQTAKNEAKNYIRAKDTEKKYLNNYNFFADYTLDGAIWQAIKNNLTDLEQTIIIMHFIYDINFNDIAQFLGMKKTTCYNIYKVTIKKLKQFYKGDE